MTGLLLSLALILLPQTPRQFDDKEIERLAGRSQVIVIAEVSEVEPTSIGQPWSEGLVSSWQYVQYNVREVLKGEVPDRKIRVGFLLFENSLTADEDQPRLSSEMFSKNNVHILFLGQNRMAPKTDKKQLPWLKWLSYESVDADYGAVKATPEAETKVRALSSAPKVAEGKEHP